MLAARVPLPGGGWFAAHRGLRAARWVLACLLLSFVILVAVPVPHTSAPVIVSYQHDLAVMTRDARYPVVAPAGLPLSWAPVSSAVALGGANGPGTATWHLGYVTSAGTLASVEQSDAKPAAFISRMNDSGTPQPSVAVAGRLWRASANPSRGQRSLYRTGPSGSTIIIAGNASWAQLRVLAASLRPQPHR